jgi:hypothetical protein
MGRATQEHLELPLWKLSVSCPLIEHKTWHEIELTELIQLQKGIISRPTQAMVVIV